MQRKNKDNIINTEITEVTEVTEMFLEGCMSCWLRLMGIFREENAQMGMPLNAAENFASHGTYSSFMGRSCLAAFSGNAQWAFFSRKMPVSSVASFAEALSLPLVPLYLLYCFSLRLLCVLCGSAVMYEDQWESPWE